MTTPAATPAPARPAAPVPSPAPATAAQARTDALSAAVTAIARHITGAEPGREHKALTMLGLTTGQATAITGKPAS